MSQSRAVQTAPCLPDLHVLCSCDSSPHAMEVDDGHTHVEDECDDDIRELPHVPRQGSDWLTQTTEDVPTSSSCESFPGGAPGCEREGARRSCCVCGDKASAYNFGVLTCDTCKAFFRRNATRLEVRADIWWLDSLIFAGSLEMCWLKTCNSLDTSTFVSCLLARCNHRCWLSRCRHHL